MPTWSPVNIVTQLAIKGGHLSNAMLLPTMRVSSHGIDKDVWKAMCSGDKKSPYFSEYCDTEEPHRQFVAFSRAMEVNAKACDELLSNKFVKVCLKPDVFNALKTEIEGILPSFNYLNATDVLAESKGSIYDMSNQKKGSRVCTATDVKTHVTKV